MEKQITTDMPHSLIDADLEAWREQKDRKHYFDGLNGIRCGQYMKGQSARASLNWDSVDCPDCLALKRAEEPWTVQIDTRGD